MLLNVLVFAKLYVCYSEGPTTGTNCVFIAFSHDWHGDLEGKTFIKLQHRSVNYPSVSSHEYLDHLSKEKKKTIICEQNVSFGYL